MYIHLIIIFVLLVILYYLIKTNKKENFVNPNNIAYLKSVQNIPNECFNKGLQPNYMPKVCFVNGILDPYSNCKCEDKDGNCKICFPPILKYKKGAEMIYDDKKEFQIHHSESEEG